MAHPGYIVGKLWETMPLDRYRIISSALLPTGRVRGREEGGRVEVRLQGYPSPVGPWKMASSKGYIVARSVHSRFVSFRLVIFHVVTV